MIMHKIKPDEIYHLGAQSHVHVSFDLPGYTAQTDAFGTLNMLEAMRKHAPKAKFYNAATSELLGDATKAKEKLGWEAKTKFKDLVEKMMKNELK